MKHLDKITHLLTGYVIFDVFATFGNTTLACFMVLFTAIAKEMIDGIRGGKPDAWDVLATIIGGGLGILIHVIA